MKGTQELRQSLAEYLEGQGLSAVTAWEETRRLRPGGVVAAVSLRGMESGPPGFQDYLGERYDEEAGQWEELYGKRVELTFGLDLSAATAEEVQAGVDTLAAALDQGGPEGLRPVGLSVGETSYDQSAKRYVCPVQAKFQAWAVAVTREDGSFLDFEVKGENKA
jgi:hypothetical protein